MGVKQFECWTCDICGKNSGGQHGTRPDHIGWIKFTIEDSMVDRMFYEKCLCRSCLGIILSSTPNNSGGINA